MLPFKLSPITVYQSYQQWKIKKTIESNHKKILKWDNENYKNEKFGKLLKASTAVLSLKKYVSALLSCTHICKMTLCLLQIYTNRSRGN